MGRMLSDLMQRDSFLQKLFNVMEYDYGAAVMAIIENLKLNQAVPLHSCNKNEQRSDWYRKCGNQAFKTKRYGESLSWYNMAMMNAPINSDSMAQAYYNRSVLLLKIKKYEQCLLDIEMCLSNPHPKDLKQKVLERKCECTTSMSRSLHLYNPMNPPDLTIYEKFFKLSGKAHDTIQCASESIEIKDGVVIAVKEIKAGEVVSVETAYASTLNNSDIPLYCHHCHNFSHNLIPCKTCCFVMFCSEECRKLSWGVVHKLECRIFQFWPLSNSRFRLGVQTVLKAVVASSGWNEFINKAKNAENSKSYYIEGPYDSTAYENLCTPTKYIQITRRGMLLDCAVYTALVLQALSNIENLMPPGKEDKQIFIHFLASQIMGRCDKTSQMSITTGLTLKELGNVEATLKMERQKAYGVFPFTKLVAHSCNPNVSPFGLGNKIILVAVANIPKGTEIVMNYSPNFLNAPTVERKRFLYLNYGFVCKCEACRDDWTSKKFFMLHALKKSHQELISELNLNDFLRDLNRTDGTGAFLLFDKVCKLYAAFRETPKDFTYKYFNECFYTCYYIFQGHLTNQDLEGKVDPHKQ